MVASKVNVPVTCMWWLSEGDGILEEHAELLAKVDPMK